MQKVPAGGPRRWLSFVRYISASLTVALAYFVFAKLGLRLASVNPSASPIWAPSGIALAAVLLGGLRLAPAILVGAFAANATTAGTLETSAVIAVGNTLEAVVGGLLIGQWAGGRETFLTPVRVAKFALVVVGPATVISASVGVVTLCMAGFADWQNFPPIWVTWWLGDAAGALVVTPVIVLWAQSGRQAFARGEFIPFAATFAAAVAVGLIVFSPLLRHSQYSSPLGFLAILPLVWAALRRGPRDTATVGLILTGFTIWGTLNHTGPFHMGINESFLLLLTFMISLSVPSLALSADVAMRRASEERVRRTQAELDRRVSERTAALADANIHLQEAQRLANLGSWSWDVRRDRVSWSDQMFEIYGVPREGFKGTVDQFLRFVHPDDRAQVEDSIDGALRSGKSFSHEERIVRPDGSLRHLQSTGEVVRDEDGAPIRMLGVCLDVTERKRAERALRQSEQSYRILLRGVRDYAIYMLDVDGNVRSWNDGAQRIKGYAAEEIIGRHFRVFLPDEVRATDIADEALLTAAREGQFEAQIWLVRKDGSRFYASVVMDAIRDESGDLVGFAKLVRDITSQHEAQMALEEAREQLAQAQKMEALGQLTGGIAHDFNNLLMIVSGYAQILQGRVKDDPRNMQAVEAIRAATSRGEKLTRQLLAFSRRQQLMPVVVDLRQRIDAVRDMLAPSLRGNIELEYDIEDKIWPVEVDLGELELALVNIAVNARDAMPDGGTITLSARNVVLKPGSAAGALEGDFVALAIIDTGCGMAPEVLARVFEPFYTTKPVGKGTGLGLSQVHGFAMQSGGAVTVSSEVGKGTAVTIYLPRSFGQPSADGGEGTSAAAGTQGTVLLVEDSREVADVTSTLLEQLGYRVVRAENAAEALRHLQQGIHFDLLFSDIVMPGPMNGLALAQTCRDNFPDIAVLLTSGYSDAAQLADGRFDILRKPFELSALERAVDAVLHGRGGRKPRAQPARRQPA